MVKQEALIKEVARGVFYFLANSALVVVLSIGTAIAVGATADLILNAND